MHLLIFSGYLFQDLTSVTTPGGIDREPAPGGIDREPAPGGIDRGPPPHQFQYFLIQKSGTPAVLQMYPYRRSTPPHGPD
ncbi:MAG: hypothetical protein ACK2UE_07915 [Anaerolineales bacterium]